METGYLIIDSGGGSTRIALVREDGTVVSIKAVANVFRREGKNGVSFDPNKWFRTIMKSMQETVRDHPEIQIRAVSATSAREGVVLIDRFGRAFIGLPNSDKRGKPLQEKIAARCNIYALTGKWCDPLFSAFKIQSLLERQPEIRKELVTFTSISEWIGYELTGVVAMEPSHACETALYAAKDGDWSEELCHVFDIPERILPELRTSGSKLGAIRRDRLDELGIAEDIPFVITGADTQAAAFSCSDKDGEHILISGTTSPLVIRMDHPVLDEKERFWLDRDIRHGWLAETNTGASGINIQRYMQEHTINMNLDQVDDEIRNRRSLACIASYGDKNFAEGRSLFQKGYCRTEERITTDAVDDIAALRMDIAFGVADNLTLMEQIVPGVYMEGCSDERLICCGGGMKSRLQSQWIADATGRTVEIREHFTQASVDGSRRAVNHYFGVDERKREMVGVFYPDGDSVILPYRERWRAYRKRINEIRMTEQ